VGGAGLVNSGSINSIGTQGFRSITANILNNTGSINVTTALALSFTGALTQSGTINVASGATFSKIAGFTNGGTLSGTGTFNVGVGSAITNNGIIAPGFAVGTTGTLSITGNLVMGAGGRLNLDINGSTVGSYDVLNVSGTATLTGGIVNLSGAGGAASYVVLNATGGLGGTTFTTINSGTLTQTPTYLANTLTLVVTANTFGQNTWIGGASFNWADALNWSNGVAPTGADNIIISGLTGSTIIVTGNQSANSLVCSANLTVSSGSLTLAAPSTITGTLTLAGGTLNAPSSLSVGDYQQTVGMLSMPTTFSLQSAAGINIAGGSISSATSAVSLQAVNNITVNVPFSASSFNLLGGTWTQVAASLPSFSVTDFKITGGTFIRALGGNGALATPYQLSDVYGLQGVGSSGMLGNAYVLANSIDAAGTVNWNAGAGFAPIGSSTTASFTGKFDGQGNAISGLFVNRPATNYVGLFGVINGATISNVGAIGGSVTGSWYVGGLVGNNLGAGTIFNSYSTAQVTGNGWYVGGLCGASIGSISNSYSTGNVSGNGFSVGGLLGVNQGSISKSYSTGTVLNSGSYTGGLVGENMGTFNATITDSYATGNVSGSDSVGGLVGYHGATDTITNTYSTGVVLGTTNAGGMVGINLGTVSNSFWNTQTSGLISSAGGTGLSTAQMMQIASFTGWSIANTGGAGTTWRIYEGLSAPLLSNFLTPITVTANSVVKTFDGITYTGGNGVIYSTTPTLAMLGTVTYGGTAQGARNAGSYAITPTSLYSNQQGYDISWVGGTLTIDPAVLTLNITANNASKTYGTTLNFTGSEFTSVGLVNGDVVSGVTLSSAGAVATANAGSYSIVPSNAAISNVSASNYTISYVNGTLTVNPAPLTVTANALSKIYGNVDPALTYAISTGALVNGDLLGGNLSRVAGQNVGSYAINQGSLNNSNYAITYTAALLNISQRQITIDVLASTKVYGNIDPNNFTIGGSGLAFSESNATAFTGYLAHTGGENVGTYTFNQGTLAANANYSVSVFTPNTLTITPAPLTVAGLAGNKILGTTDPLLKYTVAGLKFKDTSDIVLVGALGRVAGETIGNYTVNNGTLALNSANYSYNPATDYTSSNFTILAPTVVQEITQSTVTFSNTPMVIGNAQLSNSNSISVLMEVKPTGAGAEAVVEDATSGNAASGTTADSATEDKKEAAEVVAVAEASTTAEAVVTKIIPVCR
jgi:hypothetical protein